MKKFITVAVLGGLAFTAFGQSQIDTSLAFQVPDLNTAKANEITGYGDQKSSKANNLDTAVKFTQTLKLDDTNTVKAGLNLDLYSPFYAGDKNPYLGQYAAKVEPFVQYQGFGLDVQTALALYTFGPSDETDLKSGANALKFYSGPTFSPKKPIADHKNPVSESFKATYKYSVDKTLAFVVGVEANSSLMPVFFLLDAKPQASVTWTVVQADLKYNLTFKTKDADVAKETYTYTYLEPKVTYDFKDLGVAGLKAYLGGKLIIGTSNGDDLKGSSWQPGVSYGFTIPEVPGSFGCDTNLKINNVGPKNVADDTYYDLNLKASYSIKF